MYLKFVSGIVAVGIFSAAAACVVASPYAEVADRAYEAFKPAGLAVAVVEGDKITFTKAYGNRAVGGHDAINNKTLFEIGSLTKAFTAAGLALLVDEGKIGWDDPVVRYLPDFKMHDPYVTREFTIRDALTHRSGLGLGAGDLLFWPDAKSTEKDVVTAMQYLKPVAGFRAAYAYDNLMYVIAGQVIEAVSGQSWADFIETRLMAPIGMDDCRATHARVKQQKMLALPHAREKGEAVTVSHDPVGPVKAAGGIVCNIDGLSRWASFLLRGGKNEKGVAVLSDGAMAALWDPVTPMPIDGGERRFEKTHFKSYALGWTVQDYHGDYLVTHNGATRGAGADLAILPEKNLAFITLSNDSTPAVFALHEALLMEAAGDEPKEDMIKVLVDMFASGPGGELAEASADTYPDDKPVAEAPFAVVHYAGTYHDSWYGDIYVRREGDRLFMKFGRSDLLNGELFHVKDQRFVVRWKDRTLGADAYVDFSVEGGSVIGARMQAVSEMTDFSYDFHDLDLRRLP